PPPQIRKNRLRYRSASATSPRTVPALLRPNAVSTRLPGSNSRVAGRSSTSPAAYEKPAGPAVTFHVPPLCPLVTRTPISHGSAPAGISDVALHSGQAVGASQA